MKYLDPIVNDFVDVDEDLMIGWLVGQQQELELDEAGLPPRPADFVASEIRVHVEQWAGSNISVKLSTDQSQDSFSQASQLERGIMTWRTTRQQKGKEKERVVTSSMERVEEFIHSDSETRQRGDGSSSDGRGSSAQGGSGGYDTTVYET